VKPFERMIAEQPVQRFEPGPGLVCDAEKLVQM
jgi:hypothetical protein